MKKRDGLFALYEAYEQRLNKHERKPLGYIAPKQAIARLKNDELFLYSKAVTAICVLAEHNDIELPEKHLVPTPATLGEELARLLLSRLRSVGRLPTLWNVAGLHFDLFLHLYNSEDPEAEGIPTSMVGMLLCAHLIEPQRDKPAPARVPTFAEVQKLHADRRDKLQEEIRTIPVTAFGELSAETKRKLLKKITYMIVTDPP